MILIQTLTLLHEKLLAVVQGKSSSGTNGDVFYISNGSNSISIIAAGSQPFQSAAYTDAHTTDCYVWGYDKGLWESCLQNMQLLEKKTTELDLYRKTLPKLARYYSQRLT